MMSLGSLEREEVEQFIRQFESLFNAGDAAGMASFYAEDAGLLAENADLIGGRGAIEQMPARTYSEPHQSRQPRVFAVP